MTSWIDLLKFCLQITFSSFKALRPNSEDDSSRFVNEIVGFFFAFVDDLGSVLVSGCSSHALQVNTLCCCCSDWES